MDGRPWSLIAMLVACLLLGSSALTAPQEDRAVELGTDGFPETLTIRASVELPARDLTISVPGLVFQGAYGAGQGEPAVRADLVVRELRPQGATWQGGIGVVILEGDGMEAHRFAWSPDPSTALPEGYGSHRLLEFVWVLNETSAPRWSLESMVRAYDTDGRDGGIAGGVSALPPEAGPRPKGFLAAGTIALAAGNGLAWRRRRETPESSEGPAGGGVALAAVGLRWLRSIHRAQWTLFTAALVAYGLFAARINDLVWNTTGPAWIGAPTAPYGTWDAHVWALLVAIGISLTVVLSIDIWRTRRAIRAWQRLESEPPIEGDLD